MSSYAAVTGRLTADPELKIGASGVAYTRFTVAWDTRKGDNKVSHFLRVTVFGDTAEHVCASAHKGDTVTVTGRLEQSKWTGKDGTEHTEIGLVAEDVAASMRWTDVVSTRVEAARFTPPEGAPF